MEYSEAELMAVLLSREVRDGEISACGALSQLPAAGLLLAKALHAPNAQILILRSAFDPFRTSRQFHFLAQRGEMGLFFISGVQIDRHGNYNLHQVGSDLERPKMRFPGGYGGAMIYYAARRTVVFRTEHTSRTLVERVDYVSAAGVTPSDVLRLGGPSRVVTPKATFRFEQETGVLKLATIHPPWTIDDVRANTAFALDVSGEIPATSPPSEEELHVLRHVVRRTMIDTGTYAAWAEQALGVQ